MYSEKYNMNLTYRLEENASIFQAEVLAIKKAAEKLLENKIINNTITICIDSQAAIKALSSNKFNSKIVLQCYEALQTISASNRIQLKWVPGHSDIEGNEEADKLAKAGATNENVAKEHTYLPLQYYISKYKTKQLTTSTKRWNLLNTCKVSRKMWPNYDSKRTRELISLTRPDIKTITGIITGHCLIGTHALKLGLTDNDNCKQCGFSNTKETIEHLLCHCPAVTNARVTHLGQFSYDNLEELSSINLVHLKNFARKTKCFDFGNHEG